MAQYEYPVIDVEDYLRLDETSQKARYEYLEGELRMLAGGSSDHSIISINIASMLHQELLDSSCIVYNSDMKLQLSESRYVYPDVSVTCDPADTEPEDKRIHKPTIVVEVMSPSTESVDRGKKLLYYQAHPTIQDYILVDSQSILIEVYHHEKGRWTFSTHQLEDIVPVESIDFQFSVKEAYRKTSLLRKQGK